MRVSIDDQILKNIGNEIRGKNGESTLYSPGEMPGKISELDTTPELQSKTATITSNTTTTITPDVDKYGLSSVEVTTNVQPNLQTKTESITSNTTTTITPDTGYDGISSLEVTTNVEPDLSEYFNLTLTNGNSSTTGFAKSLKKIPPGFTCSNNMSYAFYNCVNLTDISNLNTSNVTDMSYMFRSTGLTSIPLIDTSNVTNMTYMFYGSNYLQTIPQLNTSNVTNFNSMVFGLPALTDTTLNNILGMCINATSYTGTKTLAQLGLTSTYYSTSRIQALSNYNDFIDAGWTIGY